MSKSTVYKNKRKEMEILLKQLADWQMEDSIFSHVTLKIPDTDYFLINPEGFSFSEVRSDDLVLIDSSGIKVDQAHKNEPAASRMHLAIHHARPNVHCVIHLHTSNTIAVSTNPNGLKNVSQQALLLHPISYFPYKGLRMEKPDYDQLVELTKKANLVVLRHHGSLCLGENPAQALLRCYLLEKACEIQLKVDAVNQKTQNIDGFKISESENPTHDKKVLEQFWQHIQRKQKA